MSDLRDGLEQLLQRKIEQSNGVDPDWATVTVRQLRELLDAHPAEPAAESVVKAGADALAMAGLTDDYTSPAERERLAAAVLAALPAPGCLRRSGTGWRARLLGGGRGTGLHA